MSTPPAATTSPKSSKSPTKSPAKSPSKSPSRTPEQNVGDNGVLSAAHWQQLAEVRLFMLSGHYTVLMLTLAKEEDLNEDDGNSLSDGSLSASTDSMTSSIFEYRKLHGRTYHREIGNAQYW